MSFKVQSRAAVVTTTTQSVTRLTPEATRVLQGRLAGIEGRLKVALQARAELQHQMKSGRVGAQGFHAAQSQLARLDAQTKFLTHQRHELVELLKRASPAATPHEM